MSVQALIADMVRQGVDPDLIGRTAELLAEDGKDSTSDRRCRRESEYPRRHWQTSAASVENAVTHLET